MKITLKKALTYMLVIAGLAVMTGCTFTPGVHLGVGLEYSGGDLRLRPHASVGVTGRP